MLEKNLNIQFAELLNHHGINTNLEGEYINTDLPDKTKFLARAVYVELENYISSRLDVLTLTDKGEEIVDSVGDYGSTLDEAFNNNFRNFSMSTLHPLLVGLGCVDPHSYEQITIEEWEINGKTWKVYMGNIVPKILADKGHHVTPPPEFFDCFERGIKGQKLTKRLHWFRGYYSQVGNEITNRAFLMDNELHAEAGIIFNNLPIIPHVTFCSCRIFIVLKDMNFG